MDPEIMNVMMAH